MTSHWDEFSKSLAQPLPRRESLRRLGLALAGAVLSPLGLQSASAGHHPKQQTDLCKSFCKCRNRKQQDQCLKACNECGKDPSRLGGNCGNYFCCSAGLTSCVSYCADLANDPYNCGECGSACEEPGPYEWGACISGRCEYACAEGAVYCNGFCTFLGWDSGNCGACGNACPLSAPVCNQGVCDCPSGDVCDGECTDIRFDPDNCGACGNVCPASAPYCVSGACTDQPCPPGLTWCQLACTDLLSDNYNCGACNNQCPGGTACEAGTCIGSCIGCEY
jgi:hypothetical protein